MKKVIDCFKENNPLIQKKLREVTKSIRVEWHWIKGHSGNQQNEIADSLARKYILKN